MQYCILIKNLKHILLDLDRLAENTKQHLLQAYKNFSKSECAVMLFSIIFTFAACIMLIINHYSLHYSVDFPVGQLAQSYMFLFLAYIGCAIRQAHRRIGQWILNISLWMLLIGSMLLISYVCLLTPFPMVTAQIAHFNQLVGFNQVAWMQYTDQHAWLKILLQYAYSSLPFLLVGTLLTLLITGQFQEAVNQLNANFIAGTVGVSIFFFFPTLPPAAILKHAHFPHATDLIIQRYQAIQHHLSFQKDVNGLIPFPSFHVIWSCICVLALRKTRWVFLASGLLVTIIIASTMLLGWHYAADVIAGIVIAVLSYTAATPPTQGNIA